MSPETLRRIIVNFHQDAYKKIIYSDEIYYRQAREVLHAEAA
jgi:hypothetical protein